MMKLAHALRLPQAPRLALVGAGGKTTAMFRIADQLEPPVILTCSAHMAKHQAVLANRWISAAAPEDVPDPEIIQREVLLITGEDDHAGKLGAVSEYVLKRLLEVGDAISCPILIEADGSRQLSLKAPAEHEPPIPAFCDIVVTVAGLSALGKTLNDKTVHRAEYFAKISGLQQGEAITPEAIARVLTHPLGGLKNVPREARRIALLNQADSADLQAQGAAIAQMLLPHYSAALIASLDPGSAANLSNFTPSGGDVFAVHERAAGIVLAAGASRRFGNPKLLMSWKGEPLIRHVAKTALAARLDPVVVVAGDHFDEISSVLGSLPVSMVHNLEWEQGQSASLRTGLQAVPEDTGAALFLLGDQPQITPGLVSALVESHAGSLAPLVAPLVDGQRANPVLFDRSVFADLMLLRGDVGGRNLFSRYPISWVEWHDRSVLLDVDTPEDYQRLLQMR